MLPCKQSHWSGAQGFGHDCSLLLLLNAPIKHSVKVASLMVEPEAPVVPMVKDLWGGQVALSKTSCLQLYCIAICAAGTHMQLPKTTLVVAPMAVVGPCWCCCACTR